MLLSSTNLNRQEGLEIEKSPDTVGLECGVDPPVRSCSLIKDHRRT